MTIEFVAKQLFGYDAEKSKEKIGEKFAHISQGLLSFPLNIPGTTYHRCLKVAVSLEITQILSHLFRCFKSHLMIW